MAKSRNKMLVLLTDVYKRKGGIPVFNQNLLKALRKVYPGEIVVLAISDVLKESNDHYSFEGYSGNKVRFVFKTLLTSFIDRPDFIICGHVNISPLCLLVKRTLRIPYTTITHGIDAWDVKSVKRRKGLVNSDLIVSVSNYTKAKIMDHLKVPEDRFFILPNTVDGGKFKPGSKPEYLVERYGVEDKVVLLTICRLERSEGYKGYDKIIEALPMTIREIPNLVYLIGGKGSDVPRIKELIRKSGLENHVRLIGFIPEEELVDHYNLCDVFAMPSKGEGFGIVFLEALACGKPVIAGNKDGSVDALLNGKLGLLVDPEDRNQIERAILTVLNGNVPSLNPEYLRREVLKHYGFDSFKARVKELVERMPHGL